MSMFQLFSCRFAFSATRFTMMLRGTSQNMQKEKRCGQLSLIQITESIHILSDMTSVFSVSLPTQAAQAPAVRWLSCEIRVMAIRVFTRIFTTALRNKKNTVKFSIKNTSLYFHSALLVIWPLAMLKRTHF